VTTAADIMTRKLITVPPTMDLQELATVLEQKNISGCPVLDEDGLIVGVVSKTDLIRARAQGDDLMDVFYRSAAGITGQDSLVDDEYSPWAETDAYDQADLGGLLVADVMNRNVYSIDHATPVQTVAKNMLKQKIHRYLVTKNGRFVGILSSTDLIRALAAMPEVPHADICRVQ
jgi:CBS domain-containing protein